MPKHSPVVHGGVEVEIDSPARSTGLGTDRLYAIEIKDLKTPYPFLSAT